ncbi:MAG: hypothetical protein EXR69_05090 [Myxococcales bacterium]|nr:hypothetical protein [Myxococcales bacterium]
MLAQFVLLALFIYDWRLSIVLVSGIVIVTVLLDRPIWAVGCMLGARISATATTSFFTIGKVTIGLFEPVLLFSLVALCLKAMLTQKQLIRSWPWQPAFLAYGAWSLMGMFWCTKFSDGLKDILGLMVILATNIVIICFIEKWDDVKLMIWFWIGTCIAVGMLAFFGDSLGLTNYASQWKASSSGGRETGLGQQPNWFAMNLMFIIHSCAAFALVQKRPRVRWGLLFATLFIFFSMMTSGSRGGAYSVVIGGVLVALGQSRFRSWLLGFAGVGVALMAVAYFGDMGDIGKGLNRITMNLDVIFAQDIRGLNWAACIGMFTESNGIGIGPGGYIENLQKYSDWLYHSVYRYPHGIFWGEVAHHGVPGVMLLGAIVVSVTLMARDTIRYTKGTEAEVLAWAMPASMAGYFAWSFVEFSFDEKPFWEWLGLYTALHLVARRAWENEKAGRPSEIPKWTLKL